MAGSRGMSFLMGLEDFEEKLSILKKNSLFGID
jgi:hypothetical protein